ncbi:hypothetical protein FLA105534_00210 [Flavobacterium bizetiae]|uniref:Uncharacterized protein n=1 Tax=Flavobacterium bizetiae TaxID=2704140 RepID=A0A6J4G6L1_9FLAO|nr:hypothetical protein FLA105534_00210 [Flavobacterium bizetiae]CAD5340155.1 hypothetical protein FLA105535_00109 [Flavobacterium bizetiae]CAD5346290.1 hypothetical protein FLA105534_00231 [Flavobacterium bizetiae]
MPNFIYCLFFIFLNLSLFLILSKKVLLNRYINLSIIAFFIIVYLIHQLNLLGYQINPSAFRKLCFFSIALIFWFYLNSFFLKQMETKKNAFNHFNKSIYILVKKDFLIYFLFVMTTITQIDWVYRIK